MKHNLMKCGFWHELTYYERLRYRLGLPHWNRKRDWGWQARANRLYRGFPRKVNV